ncbi:hypothetical protein WN51_13972 [Melipona quadrifasciata]|uniref:Uncharacterized protein n=1 Tax=Melipona quadrifasciata TaxID=166423 RepID=A0A0N0U4Z9_9HYME|nr:hypothetical protein WN51_13972 [Melipona quadrifasciata]
MPRISKDSTRSIGKVDDADSYTGTAGQEAMSPRRNIIKLLHYCHKVKQRNFKYSKGRKVIVSTQFFFRFSYVELKENDGKKYNLRRNSELRSKNTFP